MADAMHETTTGLPRRTVLRRGLLFIGGVLGAGLAGTAATGGIEGDTGRLKFNLRGANWQSAYPDRRRGILPAPGERSSVYGELFAAAEERKLGEFYASSFRFGSPFGISGTAAGAMEMHQFNLVDGTLIGIGTVADVDNARSVHAIIGGTGRYEGASGSYTAAQRSIGLGGDGTADFEFNVIVRGA